MAYQVHRAQCKIHIGFPLFFPFTLGTEHGEKETGGFYIA